VLNWEKCHFMVKEGIVLGHKISEKGIEVDRAKMLMAKLSSLSPEKRGFVVIDEAFKGTGNEAEELSYWYAQQLGRFSNCMCLNATHYPKLTLLERETQGMYHNYKVEVTFDPQGKLVRPFKLERGYTLYNIAEHILIEQGLKRQFSSN